MHVWRGTQATLPSHQQRVHAVFATQRIDNGQNKASCSTNPQLEPGRGPIWIHIWLKRVDCHYLKASHRAGPMQVGCHVLSVIYSSAQLYHFGPLSGIAGLALISYKLILHPLFFSPLSNIPAAHVTAPISTLWLHYIRFVGRESRTIYELHKHKGPVLRTALQTN